MRSCRGSPRSPREGEARRGRGEDRAPARARQAHRPRADRPPRRSGHLRRARHPGRPPLLAAGDGGQGGAGRRRDHRLGRRRGPHLLHRRLRLHRDGGLDGHDRRVQGRPPARDGARQAHAVHLAAGLGRRPHPGGGRLDVRRLRPPVPRGGDDVRRHPPGRRDARALRRRHRVHPGALGLRADGRRAGRDGARRPAPDQGGHRRGHLDGGSRRGAGPLPRLRRRRPRGEGRRRVHPGGEGLPLPFPAQLRGGAAAPGDERPGRPDVRGVCSTSSPSRRDTPTTCTT